MQYQDFSREVVAIHEAGHAVAGVVCGLGMTAEEGVDQRVGQADDLAKGYETSACYLPEGRVGEVFAPEERNRKPAYGSYDKSSQAGSSMRNAEFPSNVLVDHTRCGGCNRRYNQFITRPIIKIRTNSNKIHNNVFAIIPFRRRAA